MSLIMGSPWNHAICAGCYRKRERGREPIRMRAEYLVREVCCFCGEFTKDGIYYRADPREALCKGEHVPRLKEAIETNPARMLT